MSFFAFFAVYILPSASPASADGPNKFTYQGNLRQAGFLVNGTRSMVFRIYSSSNSLSPVWTSPATVVQISTGVFRAELAPDDSVWDNSNLWLELEVEGTKMAPMEEITASPYALNTNNTKQISGKKYTTSTAAPQSPTVGDLWMNNTNPGAGVLKYWDGASWTFGSGAGLVAPHAPTHAGGGSDPILSLGAHAVTGSITLSAGASLLGLGAAGVTVGSNLSVNGVVNQYSNLVLGGPGYSVTVSSSLEVLSYGVFQSTVNMIEGNLKYGSGPAGKVLKSLGDGYAYWGNDNSSPFNGDPYRLQMANATGDMLVNSLFLQNPAESNITLIKGSSLTVTGALAASGPAALGDSLDVTGLVTGHDGLVVEGNDANIKKDLYVAGNSQLGNDTAELHSINRVKEPGVALSVDSAGTSGAYAVKFYSGGALAAWIRKK